MRRSVTALALILAATAGSGIVAAQGAAPMNLKGTWVGLSESIVRGSPMHHAPAPSNAPELDNVLFTYTISGQDGRRFWGKVSSPRNTELVTGVIGLDGKTIVAEDSDGLMQGTIIDPDTIDIIYAHTGTSTVVAVNRLKRQK
jgi:hypothetical protein